MSGGLTPQGYVAETVDEIVTDLNSAFLTKVDKSLDLAPDQPIGQLVGIFAEKIAELEELAATVYNALNPNAAEGQLLDNVCALSGTIRQVATFSTVTCNMFLQASTTVNSGSVVSVAGQSANTWVLTAPVTSTTAGTYPGTFRATVVGPIAANPNTIQVINTPAVGWVNVNNPLAAALGLAEDTDTELRQKRQLELAGEGAGDLDAIRAAVIKVPGVIQAFVLENTGLTTDVNGIPGKAFEAIVWDGPSPAASDTAIAQTIWNNKPSGIQPFGTSSALATDSASVQHSIGFTRATQHVLYVNCTTTPSTLTLAQTNAVKASLAAYAQQVFNLGVSVFALPFRNSAMATDSTLVVNGVTIEVPGFIQDVPVFQFGFSPNPTNTANISITALTIATLDTSNIRVNGI